MSEKMGQGRARGNGAPSRPKETGDRLADIIASLTSSGETTLNATELKELKNLCRASDAELRKAFFLLMARIQEPHSQVRLSGVLIIGELFVRSHLFRQLLVDEFQQLIQLCVGREPDHPLPKPQRAAEMLRDVAVRAIAEWHAKYGQHYRKLAIGYDFLRDFYCVDFETLKVRDRIQQQREAEYAAKRLKAMQQRWDALSSELEDVALEVEKTLAEINEGLSLLLPPTFEDVCAEVENDGNHNGSSSSHVGAIASNISEELSSNGTDAFVRARSAHCDGALSDCSEDQDMQSSGDDEGDGDGDEERGVSVAKEEAAKARSGGNDSVHGDRADPQLDAAAFARRYGLATTAYELSIELTDADLKITRDADNAPLVDSVMDALVLVQSRHLPAVHRLVDAAARIDWADRERDIETAIKNLIDMKEKLNAAVEKARGLGLEASRDKGKRADSGRASGGRQNSGGRGTDGMSRANGDGDEGDDVGDDEEEDIVMTIVKDKDGYENGDGAPDGSDAPVSNAGDKEGYEATAQMDDADTDADADPNAAQPTGLTRVSLAPSISETPVPARGALPQKREKVKPVMEHDPTIGRTTLTFNEDCIVVRDVQKTSTIDPLAAPTDNENATRVNPSDVACEGNAHANRNRDARNSRDSAEGDVVSTGGAEDKKERVRRLMKIAPVVPYGTDLSYWTGDILPTNANELQSFHRFWASKDIEPQPTSAFIDQVMSRVSYYEPMLEAVNHQCRAPIAGGRLCTRRDRERCPFHGKIVPRDDQGAPIGARADKAVDVPKGGAATNTTKRRREESGGGVERKRGKGETAEAVDAGGSASQSQSGRGGRRRANGGLEDVRPKETVRERIARRILHPAAVRRVGDAIEAYESQKHGDKYGSLWQYS